MPDFYVSPPAIAVPEYECCGCGNCAIRRLTDGSSEQPSTSQPALAASSATETPIPPTFQPWSTEPKCGSLKPAPSTAPSVRPTASGSVRSRNSAGLPGLAHLDRSISARLPQTK